VPYHESLRTQFVEIRYDAGAGAGAGAQPMGLFTHIEKLGGKSYLERRGWIAGSNVYKVAAFNFNEDARLQTLADGKAGPGFEELLEIENDSGNHGAIVQTVKALADDGTPFADQLQPPLRPQQLPGLAGQRHPAGQLGHGDQNFGLYQPLGGGATAPWCCNPRRSQAARC
jgi:spore coat protein H